jgi:hypothetical protein
LVQHNLFPHLHKYGTRFSAPPSLFFSTVEIDPVLDKQMAASGFVASDRSCPRSDEDDNISLDCGFIVQRSSDTSRVKRLQGLNGETCYCLRVDHFSGTIYGETFRSKAPPIDFLNQWLARHGLPVILADIATIAERLQNALDTPSTIDLVLAPETLHLRLHDLRRVCALQSVTGEGMHLTSTRYPWIQSCRTWRASRCRK